MKKPIITLWMLVAISVLDVFSQAGMRPGESTLSAMEKLSFLEGNWTGEGWIQMGPEKHQFVQEETVARKVNNAVLVIDGLGRDAETQEVIHQAFAVISFDAARDEYLMRAYRADGNYVEAEARVDEEGSFVWGFSLEHVGEVRYTTRLADGKWVETGEMNRDGNWFPFFGMTLVKE